MDNKTTKRTLPDGSVEITLDDRAVAALEAQRAKFVEKFGREPGEGDPIFFDSDFDIPTPIDAAKLTDGMAIALAGAGMKPALVWTFIRTGLIPADMNLHLMSREDKRDMRKAQLEYQRNPGRLSEWLAAARKREAHRAEIRALQPEDFVCAAA